MSKTIEALKKAPAKIDVLHEHVADTYFYQKARKKKSRHTQNRLRLAFLASSLFVASLLLIAASSFLYKHHIKFLKEKTVSSGTIKIFNEGRVNKEIINQLEFRGYAKAHSELSKELIVLNNPKKYNWAELSIGFKFPINFSNRKLALALRGKTGGEKLHLVLRDDRNRSCRLPDLYLISNWKTETVSFDDVKENIDLSKITHLRFEYGDVGESSKRMDSFIDVTIFIKTIEILREG
ncbi:MAG: hypothetical protein HZC19_03160 [Candidatus Omnitrophica bacterium]|nr:hypothetical protein [Candidatus Omnitrophota bacterium]